LVIVAIIPARFASTRLPGKPLSLIHGRPLIQHVYERASRARRPSRLVVATDDERIAEAVLGFGGEAVMTSALHASGTDRVAEAARRLGGDIVVNVQGDEPLLDPSHIDAVVEPLLREADLPLSTLSVPCESVEEMLSASVVKVVTDSRGDAMYFSRCPIPHVRADTADPRAAAERAVKLGLARKHVGLYAYRQEALQRWTGWPPTALEEAERLEQLRPLQHGLRMRVVVCPGPAGPAVDTPEDLERVRALLAGASA
jgi:3-deoxy-manno-octulosonate cytidylyltransferase (CMP-KDO synthetase)